MTLFFLSTNIKWNLPNRTKWQTCCILCLVLSLVINRCDVEVAFAEKKLWKQMMFLVGSWKNLLSSNSNTHKQNPPSSFVCQHWNKVSLRPQTCQKLSSVLVCTCAKKCVTLINVIITHASNVIISDFKAVQLSITFSWSVREVV